MEIILIISAFLASQVVLEKFGLPVFLEQKRLRVVLLFALLGIGLSVLLDTWLSLNGLLAGGTTIVLSSVISYKYRKKFEDLERGKQV